MHIPSEITGSPVAPYLKTGLIIPTLGEPEYRCPCCGSYGLTRDDMADDVIWPAEWLARITAIYGAGVCNGCADEHVETSEGIRHRERAVYCKVRDCWVTEDAAYRNDERRWGIA